MDEQETPELEIEIRLLDRIETTTLCMSEA